MTVQLSEKPIAQDAASTRLSSTTHTNYRIFGESIVFRNFWSPRRIVGGRVVTLRPKPAKVGLAQRIAAHRAKRKTEYLQRATLVTKPNSGNYYSWLLDVMPVLVALEKSGHADPIILPASFAAKPSVTAMLGCFDKLQFHFVPPLGSILVTDLCCIFQANPHRQQLAAETKNPFSATTTFLTERLPGTDVTDTGPRIYISRKNAKRKIINEDEIVSVVTELGFTTLDFGDISLAEQIAVCARASVVFSPHGAGLVNIIFLRPGSAIVEARYPAASRQDQVFAELAAGMQHRYYSIDGQNPSSNDRHADFHVDPDALRKLLRTVV